MIKYIETAAVFMFHYLASLCCCAIALIPAIWLINKVYGGLQYAPDYIHIAVIIYTIIDGVVITAAYYHLAKPKLPL